MEIGCTFDLSNKYNKTHAMKVQQAIAANPYLKISNCTDIADLEYAMDELRKLDAIFGENNKTLLKLWAKFINKKKKLSA